MSDTVRCAECRRLKLRGTPMARDGLGVCALHPAGRYVSATYPRTCASFIPDEPDKARARLDWLAGPRRRRTDEPCPASEAPTAPRASESPSRPA